MKHSTRYFDIARLCFYSAPSLYVMPSFARAGPILEFPETPRSDSDGTDGPPQKRENYAGGAGKNCRRGGKACRIRGGEFDVNAGMSTCPSDDDLLEQAATGDRRAFQALMERHARPMLALAQRVSGSADDAEELVQDAFLKVWTMAPKWHRGGRAQFSTWLYRVVLNSCLDRRRRPRWSGLDEVEEIADSSPGAAQQLLLRRQRSLIQEAMTAIPERQRAALFLHYFSEISAPQAACVLEISVSAMEALLIRGKRALKKELMRRGVTEIGDML